MVTARQWIAYPTHTVLGKLCTSELLVVTCLRLWVHDYSGCTCGYPDWRGGLERAGIGVAGAAGFDALWRIVATTALRTLDLRPMYCTHLGGDEGQFLGLLGLIQRNRTFDAESILGGWCPASAARLALAPAAAFATALRANRLWLPADRLEQPGSASRHFAPAPTDSPRMH